MSTTSGPSTSTKRSGSFQALPPEIQLHILTDLVTPQPADFRIFQDAPDFEQGLATVRLFAKTCKANHDLAAHLLASLKRRYPTSSSRQYCLDPTKYAQSILNDPFLASREISFAPGAAIMPVRRIYCVVPIYAGAGPGDNESDDSTDDEEERAEFVAAAVEAMYAGVGPGDDESDDDIDDEKQRAEVAAKARGFWLTVVLTHLPNLKSLVLPADFHFSKWNLPADSLPSVEDLVLGPGSRDPDQGNALTSPTFDLGVFEVLFDAVPNVKRLTARCCFGCSEFLDFENLEDLDFSQSFLRVPDLKRILLTCVRLRTFKYTAWEGDLRNVVSEIIDLDEDLAATAKEIFGVLAALLSADSLRSFTLELNTMGG